MNGDTQSPPEDYIDISEIHGRSWIWRADCTPAIALVTAIAKLNECDPRDLPPLREVIDPRAVDRLYLTTTDSTLEQLAFRYCGYEILVRQAEIRLRNPDDS